MDNRSILALAIAVAAASLWAGVLADTTVQYGGTTVEFVGQSGQFKIFPTNLPGHFFKVKMGHMTELTPSGAMTTNKVTEFASSVFSWVGPTFSYSTDAAGNAVNTSTVSFVSNSINVKGTPVTLNMTTVMYARDATIIFANQSVSVTKGTLKFTVTISNWPFLSTSNSLSFGIDVQGSGIVGADATITMGNQRRFIVDQGGFIDVVNVAVVDGTSRPIDTSTSRTGATTTVAFKFPYFASNVVYDPVVGMLPYGMASTKGPAVLLVAALAFVGTALAAFF